jgi:hypothetical protein
MDVDEPSVEVGLIVGTRGSRNAVRWPRLNKVWSRWWPSDVTPIVVVGIVPIARSYYLDVVIGVVLEMLGYGSSHRCPTSHGERATLAKIILHIDYE